jgi:hypothetical protein
MTDAIATDVARRCHDETLFTTVVELVVHGIAYALLMQKDGKWIYEILDPERTTGDDKGYYVAGVGYMPEGLVYVLHHNLEGNPSMEWVDPLVVEVGNFVQWLKDRGVN